MRTLWPKVRLGEVLRPVSRAVTVDPVQEYRLLGVRLEGHGPFLRETLPGSRISARALYRVERGDFIYSRLFAWRGAFGVIGSDLHGCQVSGEFPTFLPDAKRLDCEFLNLWFRLGETLRRVAEDCSGSTPLTRNRFKEQFFLNLEVPLPPLSEQRRIVARLGLIAGQIAEVHSLASRATKETEVLLRAMLASDNTSTLVPMADLVRLREPDVRVRLEETYQFAGVYSFGRGVFRAQQRSGLEFAYPWLTRLRAGDFVYPKLMAWEGAFGVVPPECDGLVVSTEFPVFEVDHARVFPEVLDTHFRDPAVWVKVAGASTGTNVRRRRLNPQSLLSYEFPVPSRRIQQQLRFVRARVNEIERKRESAIAELDALLPAILDRAFKGAL